MTVRELYEQVLSSKEFKDSELDYLAHFFVMLDDKFEQMTAWQVGFYNKKEDCVVSFDIGDKIVKTESKAFKRAEHEVGELKIEDVKIDFEEALERARKFQKEKFPGNHPVKTIMLLQTIDGRAIWNITFVTAAFNVLNIKLNAKDNQVIDHKFSSLLSWKVN